MTLWRITNQSNVEELNIAMNEMWGIVAHMGAMSRWGGAAKGDVVRLRGVMERLSERLNEAIIWEAEVIIGEEVMYASEVFAT